jgi:hypothetical protein
MFVKSDTDTPSAWARWRRSSGRGLRLPDSQRLTYWRVTVSHPLILFSSAARSVWLIPRAKRRSRICSPNITLRVCRKIGSLFGYSRRRIALDVLIACADTEVRS